MTMVVDFQTKEVSFSGPKHDNVPKYLLELAYLLDNTKYDAADLCTIYVYNLSQDDKKCLFNMVKDKDVRYWIKYYIDSYDPEDNDVFVSRVEKMHNLPVPLLLEWFNNPKSGKRREAAKQLRQRFIHLNYEDQLTIMDLFINKSVQYRRSACRILSEWREPRYDDKLIELWNTYHEKSCAWAMIKQFPTEKLLSVADSITYELFENVREENIFLGVPMYYTLCRRLVGEKGFTVIPEYLIRTCNPDNFISLIKKSDIKLSEETCRKYLYNYLVSRNDEDSFPIAYQDSNGDTCFSILVDHVLSMFAKMGYYDFVRDFLQWERVTVNDFLVQNINEIDVRSLGKGKFREPFVEFAFARMPENFEHLPRYSADVMEKANELYKKLINDIINKKA